MRQHSKNREERLYEGPADQGLNPDSTMSSFIAWASHAVLCIGGAIVHGCVKIKLIHTNTYMVPWNPLAA